MEEEEDFQLQLLATTTKSNQAVKRLLVLAASRFNSCSKLAAVTVS